VRRFDANFNLIGAQSIDLGSNQTTEPSISFFADGSYVIVYTVGTGANADIVARIVSPTGIVGSQFDVLNQPNASVLAEVVALPSGNFAVVIQDENSATINGEVITSTTSGFVSLRRRGPWSGSTSPSRTSPLLTQTAPTSGSAMRWTIYSWAGQPSRPAWTRWT
jgi:hypothetical protein